MREKLKNVKIILFPIYIYANSAIINVHYLEFEFSQKIELIYCLFKLCQYGAGQGSIAIGEQKTSAFDYDGYLIFLFILLFPDSKL